MNTYLMIAMILANVIAIGLVYQFIKKLPKKEIIVFLAISVGLTYILISIVYWISGFGVEEAIHEGMKNFVTYLFVPVNVILFVPYLASKYAKLRENRIKKEQLQKRVIQMGILFILVLVVEYFYFCNIQKNVKQINKENNTTYQNQMINEIENEEINHNEI